MAESEIEQFKQSWRAQVAAMADAPRPSIQQQRDVYEAEHSAVPPAADCTIEPIDNDTVRGERIIPAGADRTRALLYFHGGGHAFGSSLSHRHLVSRLARAAGVVAYNMDYSLAPERPFPAGLDDAINAWRFVHSEGFAPGDIIVGGESAGGNLTLAMLVKLLGDHAAQPAGAYLLSPWLDLTQSGEAYELRGPHDPIVTREALQMMARLYCGDAAPTEPLISPLNADLDGLPPLLIQVGSDEVLLGDSTRLAHRAALAGIDVTLRVWPEMVHAWPLFHHALPTAGNAALAEAGRWIAQRLAATNGMITRRSTLAGMTVPTMLLVRPGMAGS